MPGGVSYYLALSELHGMLDMVSTGCCDEQKNPESWSQSGRRF